MQGVVRQAGESNAAFALPLSRERKLVAAGDSEGCDILVCHASSEQSFLGPFNKRTNDAHVPSSVNDRNPQARSYKTVRGKRVTERYARV